MLNRLGFLLFSIACMLCTPAMLHARGPAIVVGQAIDLSGPNAALGRDYVAGIKTYFDMVNAAGGIHGRHVRFVALDDRGSPAQSAKIVGELIDGERVDYLVGGVGEQVTRAVLQAPAFVRSGHVLFAPLALHGDSASERVLYWRPHYSREIRHVFDHFSKLGMSKVAVVYQNTLSAEAAFHDLAAEIRTRGMRLAGSARLDADAAQAAHAAQAAASVAGMRPDFVLVLADTIGNGLFLREFRKRDARTIVAGTSLTNLETLREIAGAAAVEWTVYAQVVPDPASGASLLQFEHLNMMRKYRDEPVSALTLEGFAVAKALGKMIEQARGNHAVKEFVSRRRRIDLGGITITAAGDGEPLSNYLDIALLRKGGLLVY